jgi:hypothetical protein
VKSRRVEKIVGFPPDPDLHHMPALAGNFPAVVQQFVMEQPFGVGELDVKRLLSEWRRFARNL